MRAEPEQRKIFPLELLLTGLSVFARGRRSTFAQIWREYSQLTSSDVAYKPFQLVKPEFEALVEALANRQPAPVP